MFWVVLVGRWCDRRHHNRHRSPSTFTSYEFGFSPCGTSRKQAETGPATVIIGGLGSGYA